MTRGSWRRNLDSFLKRCRHKGAWQLCLYSYVGLCLLDLRPQRLCVLAAAHCFLYVIAAYPHSPGEREHLSYYWSKATTAGTAVAIVLSVASISGDLIQMIRTHTPAIDELVIIIPSLIFSFLIALCVYVRILLYPADRHNGSQVGSCREDRMVYVTMFSGIAQCVALIFAVTLIGQHLGYSTTTQSVIHLNSSRAVNLVLWDFYCFAGGIVWLLRPFIAKAVEIRDNHLD